MMTLLPLAIFIVSSIACLLVLVLVGKILSPRLSLKKREVYEMGVKAKIQERLPIKFHLPAVIFIFWSTWLLFFLLPWIFIYQKEGMSYHLSVGLIFISAIFVIGYLIGMFTGAYKEKRNT